MKTFCAFFLLSHLAAAAQPSPRPKVAIVPLGTVEASTLEAVKTTLENGLPVDATILAPLPLPDSARLPLPGRYGVLSLLAYLEENLPSDYRKVVGVTSVDITLPNDRSPYWGVFGGSWLSRAPAVISTSRLRGPSHNRTPRDVRAGRVAILELGHTLGVQHCSSPRCLMEAASGSIRPVDQEDQGFCSTCRQKLLAALSALP